MSSCREQIHDLIVGLNCNCDVDYVTDEFIKVFERKIDEKITKHTKIVSDNLKHHKAFHYTHMLGYGECLEDIKKMLNQK